MLLENKTILNVIPLTRKEKYNILILISSFVYFHVDKKTVDYAQEKKRMKFWSKKILTSFIKTGHFKIYLKTFSQ